MQFIPNDDLSLQTIPAADAPLSDLWAFAHTFNGYEAFGSFEACAEIANRRDHSSLDHLRGCLFFEARRWRHFGELPDAEAEMDWREIVQRIRDLVAARTAT
jgi:hypothetical protein